MSQTNQLQLTLDFTGTNKKQSVTPEIIGEWVNSLSLKPYIPFWSLLLNQSIGFPYPDDGDGVYAYTGHQFSAEILLKFRLHPVFITARKAELAIRRNDLNALNPDSLLEGVDPKHLPLLENLGLNGRSFGEELLSLAVVYQNSYAISYLLDRWSIAPDVGMDAAVGEGNPLMVHQLIMQGASTGFHLQEALSAKTVSIDVVKVLLHHKADISLKLGNTGNNAYSCAMKVTSKKHRKDLMDLLAQKGYSLSDSELRKYGGIQLPKHRYSLDTLKLTGQFLIDANQNFVNEQKYCNQLICESSTEALHFIVDAFLYASSGQNEYTQTLLGRGLRFAIFHKNFQNPENLHELRRVLHCLTDQDKKEILCIFQSFYTDEAREILKAEVPISKHGVNSRLRGGESPYSEGLKICYPDTVEEIEIFKTGYEGLLLGFMPTNDYRAAVDESKALSKTTELLVSQILLGVMPEDRQKCFIRSLIVERRLDMNDRVNGLWCIFSSDDMRSDDWHELVHRPSIQCTAWLIWLFVERPEWIQDVFDDAVTRSDARKQLRNIIDSSLKKIARWKLSSRWHGKIFQIEMMELMKASGVELYFRNRPGSTFERMWEGLMAEYRTLIEQGESVTVDAYVPMGRDVGFRDDVDVTNRVARMVR